VSLILALTMGSAGHDANSFLNNVRSADTSNIVSTMIGGTIFIWPTCSWWLPLIWPGLPLPFLSPSESRLLSA